MKKLTLILFSILCGFQVFAQAPIPENDTVQNEQNWFTYFAQYKLSPKWGIHTDVQFRMDESVKFSRQNLLRAGLIHYINPSINVTAGYGYINSYDTNFRVYFSEHRIWEQLIIAQKIGSLNMTHRFRLEQRFVEKLQIGRPTTPSNDDYNYGNRFRYFNRTILNLTRNQEAKNVFYVALQDEVFLNIAAPELNRNTLDQNRLLLAFGIFHEKQTRLEVGYMNQFSNPYNRANTMNHILHFSVLQTLNFGKEVSKTPVDESSN